MNVNRRLFNLFIVIYSFLLIANPLSAQSLHSGRETLLTVSGISLMAWGMASNDNIVPLTEAQLENASSFNGFWLDRFSLAKWNPTADNVSDYLAATAGLLPLITFADAAYQEDFSVQTVIWLETNRR